MNGISDVQPEEEPGVESAEEDLEAKSMAIQAGAVKKLTGQFTNRIFVQHLGDGLLRMSFGDVSDMDDPNYHTALVVTAANAASFAELIYRMAQEAAEITPSATTNPSPTGGGDAQHG